MLLQNFIWPESKNQKKAAELYYHSYDFCQKEAKQQLLNPGTVLSFDTYFNSFAAGQWKRYTNVERIRFCLKLSGKGTVSVIGINETDKKQTIVDQHMFQEKELNQVVSNWISLKEYQLLYIKIEALQSVVWESGFVETDCTGREIHLAFVTCTYNRKEALLKNIRLLEQKSAKHKDSPVLDTVIIVDNASNLDPAFITSKDIHVIPNKNLGGAGGFKRGLQEAIQQPQITHVLLMDDDVELLYEALIRTKNVLTCLKQEKKECFLGGAMLRMDTPYLMHAAGECWNNGRMKNPYKKTDLRSVYAVQKVSEEISGKQQYAGWWYCCIPRSHIEQKGYPMPFFLHMDDIEYNLRNGNPPIFFNGIAVWHEEFEDKRSSVIEYYDVRNRLITNALYCGKEKRCRQESWRNALLVLCERFYATVFRYRYRDFTLSVKAVEDFLKGPDWLMKLDAEEYHKSLGHYGYQARHLKTVMFSESGQPKSKGLNFLAYLLPARKTARLRMGAPVSSYRRKKKVLLVDPNSEKAILVHKSWKETGECICKAVTGLWKLLIQYPKANKEWQSKAAKLMDRKDCE